MTKLMWHIRRYFLLLTDFMKRFLLKIFPRSFLRKLKRIMFNPKWVKQTIQRDPFEQGHYPNGFNVFGYFKARIGLGQGARLMLNSIQSSGKDYALINIKVGNTASQIEKIDAVTTQKKPKYAINLILVNIGQMDYLYQLYPKQTWDKRYQIGYWLWELQNLPIAWKQHIDFVDEIWVPTQFIHDIFVKETNKPIFLIPFVIEPKVNPRITKADYGLPKDRFIFLTMFDSLSTIERKNPLDAIQSYIHAFEDNDKTLLVVKVNNKLDKDILTIKNLVGTRKDVMILTDHYDMIETHSLINLCDVLISLHRSEGFGLPIAEAMYFGKIVVATNWSGNTDFMNQDNAFPIPFDLIEITSDHNMYKKGEKWANPDLLIATEIIKNVYDNYESFEYKRINAAQTIRKLYSAGVVDRLIKERYKQITGENS